MLGSSAIDIIETIVLPFALFMIIYLVFFQPHQVKGTSMVPNFEDGELLLTDKISYRLGEPKRGDVIVFHSPTNRRDDFIKRVIGLPGNQVLVKDGKVFVNDKQLDEKYLPDTFITAPGASLGEGIPYTVPKDEYIVFGDNRAHSSDSRSWGSVKRKEIIGKAWVVYWPLRDAGFVPTVKYTF